MRHQRLNGGLGKERQVGEVHAILGLEGCLVGLAQLSNISHVHFMQLSQLGCGVQGFQRLLCGDLADAVHALRGAAQGCLGRVNALGGHGRSSGCGSCCRCLGCGWCRFSGTLACGCQNILLADTPANTCAGDGTQIDTVLVGELADQRCHVRHVIIAVYLSLRCWRSSNRLRCFYLGSNLNLFLGYRSRWCGCRRCGCCVGVADADDDGSDVNGVVFVVQDFDDGACYGGGDLGVDFVGGDF